MKKTFELWKVEYTNFKMGQYYSRGMDECKVPEIFDPFIFAMDIIHYKYLQFICTYKGHDWEDNSHASPESGNMDMYCKRCGETFHHILY